MKVKAPISGWLSVSEDMAFRFAVSRYKGMTCKGKYERVCQLVKGAIFTEQELRDECRVGGR